jgi:hypothetical protein
MITPSKPGPRRPAATKTSVSTAGTKVFPLPNPGVLLSLTVTALLDPFHRQQRTSEVWFVELFMATNVTGR